MVYCTCNVPDGGPGRHKTIASCCPTPSGRKGFLIACSETQNQHSPTVVHHGKHKVVLGPRRSRSASDRAAFRDMLAAPTEAPRSDTRYPQETGVRICGASSLFRRNKSDLVGCCRMWPRPGPSGCPAATLVVAEGGRRERSSSLRCCFSARGFGAVSGRIKQPRDTGSAALAPRQRPSRRPLVVVPRSLGCLDSFFSVCPGPNPPDRHWARGPRSPTPSSQWVRAPVSWENCGSTPQASASCPNEGGAGADNAAVGGGRAVTSAAGVGWRRTLAPPRRIIAVRLGLAPLYSERKGQVKRGCFTRADTSVRPPRYHPLRLRPPTHTHTHTHTSGRKHVVPPRPIQDRKIIDCHRAEQCGHSGAPFPTGGAGRRR